MHPDELWCWVNHGCDEYNTGSQDEADADDDHGLRFKVVMAFGMKLLQYSIRSDKF